MATAFSLLEYEEAEQVLAHDEGRRGFLIHAVISLIVWAIVIPINVFLADEFPWSVFVVGGMMIGLIVHYVFGVRQVERTLGAHQRKVESLAAHRHAA
jgi:2TM domain-containing protein